MTYTAVVQPPSGGTPQGYVTFYDTLNGATSTIGAATLESVGGSQQASLTTNVLPIGSHAITAVYVDDADSNFISATAPVFTQTVNATPFNGNTLEFDGIKSFVQVAQTEAGGLDLTGTITLEAWIYLAELPSSFGQNMYIMGKAAADDTLNIQAGTDNRIHFYAGSASLTSNAVLQAGIWYLVTATYQPTDNLQQGQMQLYINDSLDASQTGTFGRQSNSTAPFTFGATSSLPGQDFLGFIAAPSVWGIVLDQPTIQAEITSGLTGQENGLLAYWPFSEGSGTTANDLTGNGHDGILGDGITNDEPLWVTLG